ncbi:Hypothetical predicted protein, partial [Mytilus galloprovincialis]
MAIVQKRSPMEKLTTDILGELPETENGYRYILVVSDYYTKWTESFPIPNMESSTVVKISVEEDDRIGIEGESVRRERKRPAWTDDYEV